MCSLCVCCCLFIVGLGFLLFYGFVCCVLCVGYCVLYDMCCLLCVAYCLCVVVGCWLFVDLCLLLIVSCLCLFMFDFRVVFVRCVLFSC